MSIGGEAFEKYAAACPFHIGGTVERRPGNALNLEIGAPMPRCRLRTPKNWGGGMTSLRWLASGGSPLVLGLCSRAGCPLKPNHCDVCGHRMENHWEIGGTVSCRVTAPGEFPCGCHGEAEK